MAIASPSTGKKPKGVSVAFVVGGGVGGGVPGGGVPGGVGLGLGECVGVGEGRKPGVGLGVEVGDIVGADVGVPPAKLPDIAGRDGLILQADNSRHAPSVVTRIIIAENLKLIINNK